MCIRDRAWLQPAAGSASRSQGLQGLMNFGLGSIATSVFAAARSTVSVVSSTVFAFVIAVYVLASKRVLGRQVNRMMDEMCIRDRTRPPRISQK